MIRDEFYYDSADGKSKLFAFRCSPDNPESIRGVVQLVHGMAEHTDRYRAFAEFLVGKGFVVTGEDHPGHGKSIGENGIPGFFYEKTPAETIVEDVHKLKTMTAQLYPDVPYVILGHSMGSFITRNYICRYGAGIQGAIVMGTGMQPRLLVKAAQFVNGFQRLFGGDAKQAKLVNRLAFGSYNGGIANPATAVDWLTRVEAVVDAYIEDPLCGFVFTANGFATMFGLLDRLYSGKNLEKIPGDLPVYMLSGTEDPVGDYGKGVQRTYDSLVKAGLANVRMKLYEGCRHELLNESNREEVMQDICSWIETAVISGTER